VLRLWERRCGLAAWALAPVGAGLLLLQGATKDNLTVGDIVTFHPAVTPLEPAAG